MINSYLYTQKLLYILGLVITGGLTGVDGGLVVAMEDMAMDEA
jgi:hypothetical protein